MRCGILTIGSELLDGRVQDTNAHWLALELSRKGYDVRHFLSCGDGLEDIVRSLRFLAAETDLLVVSGGLGPTSDDCTRDAIAHFCGVSLYRDEAAIRDIRSYFESRGREFPEVNERQGCFPEGAVPISNTCGTAPGFRISPRDSNVRVIFVVPGVPSELEAMFNTSIVPDLDRTYPASSSRNIVRLAFFGVPESGAAQAIEEMNLDESVFTISYRATFPTLEIVVKSDHDKGALQDVSNRIKRVLGETRLFSEQNGIDLPELVHTLLRDRKTTVATAESCTGGLIAKLLTDFSGSSEYFAGGVVPYSNEWKQSWLGVSPEILSRAGAVSHETVASMAVGLCQKTGAELGVSVSGIAGPTGGTPEKVVGTFFVGFASPSDSHSFRFFYPGSRARVRRYAAWAALDLIRRYLSGLPLGELAREERHQPRAA